MTELPLKQNLVPRFARAGNEEERSGEEIPSRIRQEKATIMEKRRKFLLGVLLLLSIGLSRWP